MEIKETNSQYHQIFNKKTDRIGFFKQHYKLKGLTESRFQKTCEGEYSEVKIDTREEKYEGQQKYIYINDSN